uniref:hypothetical protein n=1 Tax=Cyanothece sp. BG0011 TaxID=2082950 RepID=UPI0030D7D237
MVTQEKEKGKVQFIQFHQPALESGTYHLKVEQNIKAGSQIVNEYGKTYSRELTFVVQGERFGPISPNDIYAVFPPLDSLGEHSNVLPHITFKRSTLPWERFPGKVDENLPWLVLLLFRESDFEDNKEDKPKLKNITLQDLLETTGKNSNIKFPTDMKLELGQIPEQQVTVIDVKKKYVQDILPTHADLPYLAHVRRGIPPYQTLQISLDPEQNPIPQGDEYSTVICNRLPEPNGTSTVYLVSVEGRYINNNEFDFMGAEDEDLIRFVSLGNWEFSCLDPAQSF